MNVEIIPDKYYAIYNKETQRLNKSRRVQYLDERFINIPISKEVFDNFKAYKYVDGEIVYNENYAKEQEELAKKKEAERIANLHMTRGDFFEGLILAQDKNEDDVLVLIDVLDLTDIEKKIARSRVKNALDFYRGYPLIDKMCEYLKLSTDQMTMFFETKDYHYLIPVVVEETETEVE